MTREYPAMSYREAHAWEAMAKKRGVSKVARSQRGFMRAYEKAGTFAKLPKKWKEKRRNFIARHMAQAKDENLWEKGKPSRRALALIMWAYMPPGRSRRNPSKAPRTLVSPSGYAWVTFSRRGERIIREDCYSGDWPYPTCLQRGDAATLRRTTMSKSQGLKEYRELKAAGWSS